MRLDSRTDYRYRRIIPAKIGDATVAPCNIAGDMRRPLCVQPNWTQLRVKPRLLVLRPPAMSNRWLPLSGTTLGRVVPGSSYTALQSS